MLSKALLGASKAASPVYVEDVFSTYLYTGNGSIQTINNGIALGSSYGGSVYFDGTSDRITTPATGQFAPAGDFTVAWFYYPVTLQTTAMIANYTGNNATDWSFETNASGQFLVYLNGSTVRITGGAGTVVANTWNYFVVSRSGTTVTAYRNGTTIGTFTLSGTFGSASKSIRIGAGSAGTNNMFGYCSNVILIDGTALTGAIPTAPFTPVTGTMLLTCQSPSPTTDYSPNAFTLTVTDAIAQNGGGPFTDSTANKGGMVWLKSRSGIADHALYDTARGATFDLVSNSTAAQTTQTTGLNSFNSNGFSIGALAKLNTNADTYASWTFRKQDRFFDVRTVSHINGTADTVDFSNLGTLGLVIFKDTGVSQNWFVWHRTLTGSDKLQLNSTAAAATSTAFTVSGTTVTVTSSATTGTKLLYAFAHNAGGFGATGTDNAIFCGTFTTDVSGNASVTLGWEPQWLLFKSSTDGTNNWTIRDNLRGFNATDNGASLLPNTTGAEASASIGAKITATGFTMNSGGASSTYIYMAIRRPMKTPTSGASVYEGVAYTGNATAERQIGSTVLLDALLLSCRSANSTGWATYAHYVIDRLRGDRVALATRTTTADSTDWSTYIDFDKNIGWDTSSTTSQGYFNNSGSTFVSHAFSRAPGFFDVVCDTGTASAHTITHGLTVVPELIIRKKRNSATNSNWVVWHTLFSGTSKYLYLNTTDAEATNAALWTTTPPTSTVFSVGTGSNTNNTNDTYVTYLFATVAGVSKVGSYTGNGSSQTINCGFAAGARFLMIKRTDSTGDWYVWDTARGIVTANDPHLSLNTTAAEVTTDDSIDPDNSGFIVNQVAATNINVSSASYIFLAIS